MTSPEIAVAHWSKCKVYQLRVDSKENIKLPLHFKAFMSINYKKHFRFTGQWQSLTWDWAVIRVCIFVVGYIGREAIEKIKYISVWPIEWSFIVADCIKSHTVSINYCMHDSLCPAYNIEHLGLLTTLSPSSIDIVAWPIRIVQSPLAVRFVLKLWK